MLWIKLVVVACVILVIIISSEAYKLNKFNKQRCTNCKAGLYYFSHKQHYGTHTAKISKCSTCKDTKKQFTYN